MNVLDASVCVSLLNIDDVHHNDSWMWLERQLLAGSMFLAPSLLIAEVAGALARRTGVPDDGHRAVTRLRATIDIQLVPLDLARAASTARVAADLRLRGADATYVAVSHEFGVPLVTWDGEQLSRAVDLIRVFRPAELHGDSSSGPQ